MKKKLLSKLALMFLLLLMFQPQANSQYKFPEYIEHNDPTKALIHTDQFRGGYQEVTSKASRDLIPEDKRALGMVVTWVESGRYVSKRYEGINVLDANWLIDANWRLLYAEGEGLADIDSLNFNAIAQFPRVEGRLDYDSSHRALTFTNDIPNFNHQLGYEHVARFYNSTGLTIPDGTLLTPVGHKVNGIIVPTVQLAGNLSPDSLKMVGMATTEVLPNTYGVVTLIGPVNGLDLSMFNDNDFLYVGNSGNYTNISPTPPSLSMLVGKIFYADADSGQLYMMPSVFEYTPSPHISGDTSEYNQILTINTQNVYENFAISSMSLVEEIGYTRVGDSVLVDVSGFITIAFNTSYIGNAQSDVWRIGIFKNGTVLNSVSRSTTSTSVGNSTAIATGTCDAGDYISFKIKNESAIRDPTISDMSFEIIFLGAR